MASKDSIPGPLSSNVIVISRLSIRGSLPHARYFVRVVLGDQEVETAKTKPHDDLAEWSIPLKLNVNGHDNDEPKPLLFELHSVAKESFFGLARKGSAVGNGEATMSWTELTAQGEFRELTINGVVISCNVKMMKREELVKRDLDEASQSAQKLKQLPDSISEKADLGGDLSENVQAAYDAAEPILEKFEAFVTLMDKVTEVHPYVNAAWVVLSAIPKIYIQELAQNKQILELLDELKETYEFVIQDRDLRDIDSPNIQKVIMLLASHTQECAYFIQSYASKSHRSKLLATVFANPGKRIEDLLTELTGLRSKLTALLTQAAAVGAMRGRQAAGTAVEGIAFVGSELENINQKIDMNDMLYASGVSYNKKKCCLPNTRTSFLQQVCEWVDCFDEEEDQKVLLVTGVAGSGKSSVAHSICDHYTNLNRLGSSFFFNIRAADPPGGDKVFSTIARDIADTYPLFKASLAKIANTRRIRQTDQASEQFQSFIVKPANALADSEVLSVGPLLIVIDAIDECPAESKEDFVQTLIEDLSDLPPNFRVIITSRPDDVQPLLETGFIRHLDLESVSPTEVKADITLFVRNRLAKVARKLQDPGQGPCHADWVEKLVERSEMLFIWAETACKQIASPVSRTPSQVLDDILRNGGTGIDGLYQLALRRALREDEESQDPKAHFHFQALMSRLIILKMSFSINELNFMRSFVKDDVDDYFPIDISILVSHLGAVLGGTINPEEPLHFLHSTFRDFLLDKERSGTYCVNEDGDFSDAHYALANTCIAVLNVFRSKENPALTSDAKCRAIGYSFLFAEHLQLSGRDSNEEILNIDNEAMERWSDKYFGQSTIFTVKDKSMMAEGFNFLNKLVLDSDSVLKNLEASQPPPGYSWKFVLNHQNPFKLRTRSVIITVSETEQGSGPAWSTSVCCLSPFGCIDWDNSRLGFLTFRNTARVWAPCDGEYKGSPIALGDDDVVQMSFSINGGVLAAITSKDDLVFFNVEQGDLFCKFPSPHGFPTFFVVNAKRENVFLQFPGIADLYTYDVHSSTLQANLDCIMRLPPDRQEKQLVALEAARHLDEIC